MYECKPLAEGGISSQDLEHIKNDINRSEFGRAALRACSQLPPITIVIAALAASHGFIPRRRFPRLIRLLFPPSPSQLSASRQPHLVPRAQVKPPPIFQLNCQPYCP